MWLALTTQNSICDDQKKSKSILTSNSFKAFSVNCHGERALALGHQGARHLISRNALLTAAQKEGGSGGGRGGPSQSGPSGGGHGGQGGGRGQKAPQDNKNVKPIGSVEQFKKELTSAGDRLVCVSCASV